LRCIHVSLLITECEKAPCIVEMNTIVDVDTINNRHDIGTIDDRDDIDDIHNRQ
jgi:hypothetical protein